VIRVGPKVLLAQFGMWGAVALVASAWLGWDLGALAMLAGIGALTLVFTLHGHVVLTPPGLEVWWFGYTRLPWTSVGGVFEIGFLGDGYLSVLDSRENRSRRLPAPRALFGVGKRELREQRHLIEQWWATYRNIPPSPPPAAPGDPWSPPDT
jgi:hypothetical protein